MKWSKSDLEKYLDVKEYVDTVILPLHPFHLSEDATIVKDAFQLDVLDKYATEIEKKLSGRVMLVPTYMYLKHSDKEAEIERLNTWIKNIKEQPFTEIYLFTFDNTWKKVEQSLAGNLLWFPGMKTGDLKNPETTKIIRNQVEEISELIRSEW
ncbi:MAG TPA: DUF2487 family protein [Pseudogracilibacillus sp.]|nr:DUF2487 family protein [Pseudogracilibacillus sp.]